jgi:hypothetical protein
MMGITQLLISVSLVIMRFKVDSQEFPFPFPFAIIDVQIQAISGFRVPLGPDLPFPEMYLHALIFELN